MKTNRFSLEGKVAVVTGGNQGIGKTVACALAEEGADVVILDVQDSQATATEIADRFGVRCASFVCDVTNATQVKEIINEAAGHMGTLDLLFNNAGIDREKDALDIPADEFALVVNVNLNGIFYVAAEFARYLVAQGKGGSIVNTSSMSGHIVNIPQGDAHYNASKAGVSHLTRSLAVEWAKYGIRVNAISPGYMKTAITATAPEEWLKVWLDLIPAKRMGTPEELVGAVIYLLSEASSYTTGTDLVIDGGYTSI